MKAKMSRIHYDFILHYFEKAMKRRFTPRSFLQVQYRALVDGAQIGMEHGVGPGDHLRFNQAASICQFIESGRQCFELGPVLADAFLETKLDNIKPTHIRTPFNTIYILVPKGMLQVWGGERTQFHDVDGIYITQDGKSNLKIMYWGAANERSVAPNDDAVGWLTIPSTWWVAGGAEVQSVEGYLDDLFSVSSSYKPEAFGDPWPSPAVLVERERACDEGARRAVRLAINTCLYLTSPKNSVAVDKKHQKQSDMVNHLCAKLPKTEREAKKLATKVSKFKHVYLTRLGPDIEKEGRKSPNRKAPGTWVMAHWSLYWTGKGRQIPRMVFKKPYFRGNLEDKDSGKNYDVRSERT